MLPALPELDAGQAPSVLRQTPTAAAETVVEQHAAALTIRRDQRAVRRIGERRWLRCAGCKKFARPADRSCANCGYVHGQGWAA